MAIYYVVENGKCRWSNALEGCFGNRDPIEVTYSKNPVGALTDKGLLKQAIIKTCSNIAGRVWVKVAEVIDDREGNGRFLMKVIKQEEPKPGFFVNILPVLKAKDGPVAFFSEFGGITDTFSGKREVRKEGDFFALETPLLCAIRQFKELGVAIETAETIGLNTRSIKGEISGKKCRLIQLNDQAKVNHEARTMDTTTGILLLIEDLDNLATPVIASLGLTEENGFVGRSVKGAKKLIKEFQLYDYEKTVIKEALKKVKV